MRRAKKGNRLASAESVEEDHTSDLITTKTTALAPSIAQPDASDLSKATIKNIKELTELLHGGQLSKADFSEIQNAMMNLNIAAFERNSQKLEQKEPQAEGVAVKELERAHANQESDPNIEVDAEIAEDDENEDPSTKGKKRAAKAPRKKRKVAA